MFGEPRRTSHTRKTAGTDLRFAAQTITPVFLAQFQRFNDFFNGSTVTIYSRQGGQAAIEGGNNLPLFQTLFLTVLFP